MFKKGLIQVYTSESDEMNFAPIGLSLRAAGQGLRTFIMCFTHHELLEGASVASSLLKPHLVIDHTVFEQTVPGGKENIGIAHAIIEAFQRSRDAVFSGDFDIVILNGIHQASNQGLISLDEILRLMEEKPENVELVLSGPGAGEQIIEKADLVTEMLVYIPKEMSNKDDKPYRGSSTEVVTGDAKGKTTYCLGKAMLMSCMGIRSIILQFIKSPKPYGEEKAVEKLPNLEIKAMGEGFLSKSSADSENKHLQAARRAWEEGLKELFSLEYGLMVLDEINIATYYGLANAEKVRDTLLLKPHDLHLILSGRKAHLEVRGTASSVIEMKEIKHPFKKGVKARKGIEF